MQPVSAENRVTSSDQHLFAGPLVFRGFRALVAGAWPAGTRR